MRQLVSEDVLEFGPVSPDGHRKDTIVEFTLHKAGVTDRDYGRAELQAAARRLGVEVESPLVHGRQPMPVTRDPTDAKRFLASWRLSSVLDNGSPPDGTYPVNIRVEGRVTASFTVRWQMDS